MIEMHAFEAESKFAERANNMLTQRAEITLDELKREYKHIAQQYSVLLNEVMKITRVSDSTQTELRRTRKELFLALQTAEAQRNTAEKLNEQKTEILSIAAHDLKNPLASIIGLVEILQVRIAADEEVRQILDVIHSSSDRMLTLIHNLLSSSSMEMGKMMPEFIECNFLTIVSEVIIGNSARAQHKFQTISFAHNDSDYSLVADMQMLYELVDNLISNAIKYSPIESSIAVTLERKDIVVAEEKMPGIVFSVKDEGPGLSEEDKLKLFGYFQRLSARPTGGESSHGIGLAIAKKITDIHKGKIWAVSKKDEGVPGTTFFVEIPLRLHLGETAH